MELQNLKVKSRNDGGKGASRRARRTGEIPAVLYGGENGGAEPLLIDHRSFIHLLNGVQGEHAIVQLESDDKPDLNGPALVKEVQHDPVKGHILHADFLRIRLDVKINTVVPVYLEGRSKGVVEGGLMDHQLREIEVECLALDVPEYVIVDVTAMEVGDSIHVSDINVSERVTILTDPERAIAAVHAPRVAKTAAEEEAEEEAAAEEEGEKAEEKESE